MKLTGKILLLSLVGMVASGYCTETLSWGSEVKFMDLPSQLSPQSPGKVEAIVIDPERNQQPGNWSKYGINSKISKLQNGEYRVFAYRSPSSLYEICRLTVADWKSGAFDQTNHYCVKADGWCTVEGDNDGNMRLYTRQAPAYSNDHKSQAGYCR